MKTKRINYHMKDLDLLSEDEVTLRALLEQVKDTTLWGLAIELVLREGDVNRFRQLVEQLRDQAKDNPPVMQRIIGRQAMALLNGLQARKSMGTCPVS